MSNEMRKCNTCKQEKAISEFHRRGAGHLNTCKACKNEQIREYRKQEKSPRPIKDNRENFSAVGERIQALEPRLRMIAKQFSRDPHQAEDIYQHICEKLLVQADPADSDARILTTAKRRASDFIQGEKTYSFYISTEGEVVEDSIDFFVSDPRSAEDMVVEAETTQAVMQAINTLAPSYRNIVSMLLSGLKQKEIAKELGVTEAAVSQNIKTIAKQLKLSDMNI